MLNKILLCVTFLLLSQVSQAFEVLLMPVDKNTINIMAKNISPVYGGEVWVTFDNQFFEVVDQDEKKKGTQIKGGDFFKEGSYLLDNRINIRKGEIHYAAAHVRPMGDVSGDGVIASFKLKAKKSGETYLELKKAEFGTQEGELHKAEPSKLLVIADASGKFYVQVPGEAAQDKEGLPLSLETILMVVIAVLLLVVIILLIRKK